MSERDERALLRWLGVKESPNHGLPELGVWTREAVEAELQAERNARGELRDEDVELCPEELPPGLEDHIRREMLPQDAVLLYRRGGVWGTCFLCRQKVRAPSGRQFRQDKHTVCPNCGREVDAVLADGSRFKADYVENVVSLQRGTDGATVFLRQWHLFRDPTARWEDIPGQLQEIARYAVRGSRAAKWQLEAKEGYIWGSCRYGLREWTRMRNVSEVYDGSYSFHLPPDWREQVAGTSLRYVDLAGWRRARGGKNTVRFLLDWARYPAVEKLWKAGYTGVVQEHTVGQRREHRAAVNWKKNSIREAVPFPVRLLKAFPPAEWTMDRLMRAKRVWELTEKGTVRESEAAALLRSDADLKDIALALGHASIYKITRYLQGRSGQTWRDYLKECAELGLDLDDRAVLFPPHLDEAHLRTLSQVQYKRDRTRWEAFAKRLGGLQKLAWAADGLLIRPPANAGELIAEGQALNHCVGGYVDRMARGETVILLIRRAEEPDKPYYTLEWRDGQVIQCRTRHNATYAMDPPVKEFVEAWAARMAKKTGRKRGAAA